MRVESLSRRPDEDAQLPSAGRRETGKNQYDERVKRSLESGKADSLTINFAISRGDFDDARKMIDLLPDGEEKNRLTEMVNSREALSLIEKGDAIAAERLAMRLVRARSMLQVFPVLIGRAVKKKDAGYATSLVYQAMKGLKGAEDNDNTALGLSMLAKAVAPMNEPLALEILDVAVQAANDRATNSTTSTKIARHTLDAEAFKNLTAKHEMRVRSAAGSLKDRLPRIVTLAAIYQQQAQQLTAKRNDITPPPTAKATVKKPATQSNKAQSNKD